MRRSVRLLPPTALAILLLTAVFTPATTQTVDPVLSAVPVAATDLDELPPDAEIADNRVVVRFRSDADEADRERVIDQVDGAEAPESLGDRADETTVVGVAEDADEVEVLKALDRQRDVLFAEPVARYSLESCDDCWQLGATSGAAVLPLHAAGRTGDADTTVAVIDSGVDSAAADLAGRVIGTRQCGPDTDDADGDGDVWDTHCFDDKSTYNAHGTQVASIIAAGSDGKGVTGVAPGARIRSWRIQQDTCTVQGQPSTGCVDSLDVAAAIFEAAALPDVRVINLSLGTEVRTTHEREAVEAALAAGKTLVAAAGNQGESAAKADVPMYPAAHAGVIAVGASDQKGAPAPFSSYGKVDILAPGVCLPASSSAASPASSAGCGPSPRANVSYVSGTSFATPVVAGVLALRPEAVNPLRNRLSLKGTASGAPPTNLGDPKRWPGGVVDAAAWSGSFAADADPYLVMEADPQVTSTGESVTRRAYALRTNPSVTLRRPGTATFEGAVTGRVAFAPLSGSPGVWRATSSPRQLTTAGTVTSTVRTTVDGAAMQASAPARARKP